MFLYQPHLIQCKQKGISVEAFLLFSYFRIVLSYVDFSLISTVPVLRHVSPVSSVIRGPSVRGSSTESRWQLTHMVRVSKTDSCIKHLTPPPFVCHFPGAIFWRPPVRGSPIKSYHFNTHLAAPFILKGGVIICPRRKKI